LLLLFDFSYLVFDLSLDLCKGHDLDSGNDVLKNFERSNSLLNIGKLLTVKASIIAGNRLV
jgi:hypothetical protein